MKHDTFLILKLLIKFLKELVVGQGLFSAKSPCLKIIFLHLIFLSTAMGCQFKQKFSQQFDMKKTSVR